MTDEEIFAAAQKDADSIGEYENTLAKKGALFAIVIGMAACGIMTIAEFYFLHRWDFSKFVILFTVSCVMYMYGGIKSHNKKMTAWGVFFLVMNVFSLLLYVGELFLL